MRPHELMSHSNLQAPCPPPCQQRPKRPPRATNHTQRRPTVADRTTALLLARPLPGAAAAAADRTRAFHATIQPKMVSAMSPRLWVVPRLWRARRWSARQAVSLAMVIARPRPVVAAVAQCCRVHPPAAACATMRRRKTAAATTTTMSARRPRLLPRFPRLLWVPDHRHRSRPHHLCTRPLPPLTPPPSRRRQPRLHRTNRCSASFPCSCLRAAAAAARGAHG